MSKRNLTVLICCTVFIFTAFCDAASFVENARRGLVLFGNNVLPVLFPFFFISSLLIELDLFKKGGARLGVLVMSYLSGYPTGARMLAELYGRRAISRTQAIRTATYTSTASPIFMIATVGAALYGDVNLGIIIFAAHILGALLNGLVYRNVKFAETDDRPKTQPHVPAAADFSDAVSKALYNSVQNIMAVGGLIVIFFTAAAPFGVTAAVILEMTSGVFYAGELNTSGIMRAVIPCAVVSFGGLCVAMQGFIFLKSFKMPVWFYFLYKATHTVIAAAICAASIFVLGRIF